MMDLLRTEALTPDAGSDNIGVATDGTIAGGGGGMKDRGEG
jgi:hypothetical protein